MATRRTLDSIAVDGAAMNETPSVLERLFAPTRCFAHAILCAQAFLFAPVGGSSDAQRARRHAAVLRDRIEAQLASAAR